MASAFSTLTCTSSPTTTRSGGAPKRPFASTSQPWRAKSAWRAAPSPLRLAVVAQVTKPTPVSAGRPSTSTSHAIAASSSAAATGEVTRSPAFWSHAAPSTVAASAAGSDPPITKP